MKLKEKYKALQDQLFVRDMVVSSIYGSMALEEQGVGRKKIRQLYDKVHRESAVLGGK